MKANAIARIVLYTICIVLLLGLLLFSGRLTWSFRGETGIRGGTAESSFTVDSTAVKHISIDWASGSVTIQPGISGDSNIYVREEGAAENNVMVWKQSGDTLNIQFSETRVYFGLSIEKDKDLTITVPLDWNCGELEIDTASADIRISGLSIQEMDFDGASGDCRFENCQVGKLELDTASGDIVFSGTLDTLSCDAASADCSITVNNVPQRIEMNTASGDLDLILPENSGFSVSLDALSADFQSDFATTNRDGQYIYGDGSCRIDVSAMSGKVTIRKASSTPIVSEVFAVLYADNFTVDNILTPLESHYPADALVTIQTHSLIDADLELYVNGKFICKQTEAFAEDGSSYWTFTFQMPSANALIQLKLNIASWGGAEGIDPR